MKTHMIKKKTRISVISPLFFLVLNHLKLIKFNNTLDIILVRRLCSHLLKTYEICSMIMNIKILKLLQKIFEKSYLIRCELFKKSKRFIFIFM